MHRRFQEHDVRAVTYLDGVWDFAFLGDVAPEAVEIEVIAYDDRMGVPGCFDATPAYAGKRGLAAYRRQVTLTGAAQHRLILDGVHHWCRIFIDGVPIRDHAGGFTEFSVDFGTHPSTSVELVILVDNRFDAGRSPLHCEYFDWYHYGGIARGAELHGLADTWIESVQVETVSLTLPQIRICVAYGALHAPGAVELAMSLDGRPLLAEALNLPETAGTIEGTVTLQDASLWSPSVPNLHLLHVQLGDDDLRTRFGIRQIGLRDGQILINGEPVRLLGLNRHEAHPQFGHAVPEMVMIADLQQLVDMGSNFVRGSHYPQDARFLDLCDEAGICVWSEAIGWQHTAEHLTDPQFMQAQSNHIDEMVGAAVNHPSVIMWGVLNESHSHDPACRPAYEALLGRLRDLDKSRPVTYASNHPFEDVCFDLVDIISVNCYPGWYVGEVERLPEEIDRIVAYVDEAHAEKPLIIAEIGAGAIYGWRDWNEARWTEQYQARLLEKVIHHLFVDRDRAAGLAIWQFCDCRTPEAVQKILGRPRGFNNKGVVDEYRRPKQAYPVVRRMFRTLK
jgi:beta-glucuronidase